MIFILLTLVFLSTFTIYLFSVVPTVYWGDSGELIISSFSLGVSHSPGYPLFNLVSKIFQFLPINNVAFKSNLASVFFSALSISIFSVILYKLIYLLTETLWQTSKNLPTTHKNDLNSYYSLIQKNYRQIFAFAIAFITSLLFSISYSFWNATISTSVYPLYALFLSLVFLQVTNCIINNSKNQKTSNKLDADMHNIYLILAFIFFVSFSHHVLCLFLAIPVMISIFFQKVGTKILPLFFLLLLLSSLYLYIPLSSAREPIADWWDAENISNFISLLTFKGYKFTFPESFNEIQERLNIRQYFKELNIFILFFSFLGLFYLLRIAKGKFSPVSHKEASSNITIIGKILFWIVLVFGLTSFIFTALISYQTPDSLRIPIIFVSLLCSSIGISILTIKLKKKFFKVLFLGLFTLSLPMNMLRNSLFFERFNDDAEKFAKEVIKDIKPQTIIFLGGDQSKNVLEYMQVCESKLKNIPFIPLTMIKFPWIQKKIAIHYNINLPKNTFSMQTTKSDFLRGEVFNIDAKSMKLLADIIKLNYDSEANEQKNREKKDPLQKTTAGGKYKHFATSFYLNAGDQILTFPRGYLCYFYPKNIDKTTLIINDRNITPFFTRGDNASEEFLSSVYNDRGKAYMIIGEIEICEKEFRNALLISPSNTDAMSNLGVVLASKGEFEESEKLHRTSISINPYSPDLYYNYGQSLYSAKKYFEAIEMWQRAAIVGPKSEIAAKSFNNIGSVYSGLSRFDEAITSFEKAIEINPSYLNPYFNLVSVYEYNRNYQKAIEWLNKAKGQYPNDIDIREYLIQIYKKAKLSKEAERETLELMNLYSNQ